MLASDWPPPRAPRWVTVPRPRRTALPVSARRPGLVVATALAQESSGWVWLPLAWLYPVPEPAYPVAREGSWISLNGVRLRGL